jgi:hypothetical protein
MSLAGQIRGLLAKGQTARQVALDLRLPEELVAAVVRSGGLACPPARANRGTAKADYPSLKPANRAPADSGSASRAVCLACPLASACG